MAKILIVEDDPFLLSILAEKLKDGGLEIETAVDGEDALEKIKKGGLELILLDMVLPKTDGFKVLDYLHLDEKLRSTPVIVLSNLYDKNNMDKAKASGARDYIVKAYNTPEEIAVKVKNFLAGEKDKK